MTDEKFSPNSFLRAQEIERHRKDTDIWKDEIDENTYHVKSQSNRVDGFKDFTVYFSTRENKWMCNCPSYWRAHKYCKHVLAVILKLKDEKARAENDK